LEGVEKTKRKDVINLYKELKLSPQKIAKILNVPEEKVKQWLKEEGFGENFNS
jgi:DNA-binding transcriptional regulator YiaG